MDRSGLMDCFNFIFYSDANEEINDIEEISDEDIESLEIDIPYEKDFSNTIKVHSTLTSREEIQLYMLERRNKNGKKI